MLTYHQWDFVAFTEGNFMINAEDTYLSYEFENYKLKITATTLRGQWVKCSFIHVTSQYNKIYIQISFRLNWYRLHSIYCHVCEFVSAVPFPSKPFIALSLMGTWLMGIIALCHAFKILLLGDMMTSSNGNIFCVTGPLCGEFTSHLWILLTMASDVELWCFLWSAPEQTFE